jgi:hypothetical protein
MFEIPMIYTMHNGLDRYYKRLELDTRGCLEQNEAQRWKFIIVAHSLRIVHDFFSYNGGVYPKPNPSPIPAQAQQHFPFPLKT